MATLGSFVPGQILTAAEMNAIGKWETFTPTFTNLTVGNGTATGLFCVLNDLVLMQVDLTWGSSTTISAAVGLEFPEPAKRTFPDGSNGQAFFEDGDGTDYYGTTYRIDGTTFQVHVWDASSTYLGSSNITNTIPFTWADGDRFVVSHWYQRA